MQPFLSRLLSKAHGTGCAQTFFCFFGLFELLFFGSAVRATRPLAEARLLPSPPHDVEGTGRGRSPSPARPKPAAAPPRGPESTVGQFVVVCGALLSQSVASTVGSTLWPLFVRDRFGRALNPPPLLPSLPHANACGVGTYS